MLVSVKQYGAPVLDAKGNPYFREPVEYTIDRHELVLPLFRLTLQGSPARPLDSLLSSDTVSIEAHPILEDVEPRRTWQENSDA